MSKIHQIPTVKSQAVRAAAPPVLIIDVVACCVWLISYYDAIVLSANLRISKLNQFNIRLIFITFIHNIQRSNKYKYNKCIGDDTKAATRQSPNCIKKNKKIKNMAKNDFQYVVWNYYTLQCGRWLWDDMPWNSPKRPS